MKKVLGIDLGGTSAKVGVVNQFGEIENKFVVENSKENVLENLAQQIHTKLTDLGYECSVDIERIGLAVPGFINHEEGISILTNNLGWKNYDVKGEAIKLFNNKNVSVLNDVNAAALGEYWTGAASKYSSAIFYWLGTGIGGAIVIDNKLVSGANGFAGEFGHGGAMQTINKCNCGLGQCIEATCSAINFGKTFATILEQRPEHLANQYFKDGKEITMKTIGEAYIKNNKPSEIRELMDEIYKPFYDHISIMVNALNPKAVIIGGGAALMGNDLLEIIETGAKAHILPFMADELEFELASLQNDSGIIGAAFYAINNWED